MTNMITDALAIVGAGYVLGTAAFGWVVIVRGVCRWLSRETTEGSDGSHDS